jgi:type I restriction enzyme S subunit
VPFWLSKRVGGGQPNISQGIIKETKIPLPPLPEQQRIADILDKADAIRRKRQEAGRLAEKIREATFIDLFGDPRWPVQPWTEVSLSEVTDIDAPMVDPREEQYQNLIHIGPDRIEKETGRLLPAMTAAEERLISGKFLFDDRYLLYSKIRPYLRKVAMPDFTGLCSADVYPVRPKPKMATREYLFSLLISEAFLAYTQSLASRASIPKLNREEFGNYRFPLPPLALQERFTHIVKKQVVCNKRLSSVAEECDNLFNSLVQRAFRGEL